MAVEILDFTIPDACVMVHGLRNTTEEVLNLKVKDIYSQFGLINYIKCYKSFSNDSSYTALINFYSKYSAETAIKSTDGKTVFNSKVSVKTGRSILAKNKRLSYNKSIELANHCFGINGWSKQILYHKCEKTEELEDEISEATWISVVRLKIGDIEVEGVGLDKAKYKTNVVDEFKGKAFALAQKKSVQNSVIHGFEKILIVWLPNGKVKAEIDSNIKDPFFYDPIWEEYALDEAYTADYVNCKL